MKKRTTPEKSAATEKGTFFNSGNESGKEILPEKGQVVTQNSSTEPLPRDTHLNFSVPSGSTYADLVQEIAKQLNWRVEGPLPEHLGKLAFPRGRTVFGSAGELLDDIAEPLDVEWTVKNGVLRFMAGRRKHGFSDHEQEQLDQLRPSLDGIRNRVKAKLDMEVQAIEDQQLLERDFGASLATPATGRRLTLEELQKLVDQKALTRNRLATLAGVDFHTVDSYLKGKTKLRARAEVAKALGIKPESLP